VSYQADVHRRESLEFYSRHQEAQEDRATVRAEIEILRRERLANERTMAIVNQGMSVEETEQIVAQRVANAIAIYETKTNMARKPLNQTKHQEDEVARNASNKRKWEGDQNGRPNQQQNKEHKVYGAHGVGPSNKKEYAISLPRCNKCKFYHNRPCTIMCGNWKKEYARNLPLCNKCKFHYIGLCAARCENCKWRGHQARDYRISGPKTKLRPSMAK
ncbi:hypothetical protein Tco_1048803, partial [Tanacetum coccineum]